jgi:Protein of unknown function (DUF1822)
MTYFPATSTNLRLLLPETTFLEPHHVAQAQSLSNPPNPLSLNLPSPDSEKSLIPAELYQWQTYIQALALLGFTQWLSERLIGISCHPEQASIWHSHVMLQLGEFKLCLIAAEHVLDEIVNVPEMAIALTAAHFYVFVEVVEEQAEVMMRGLIRHDHLTQALDSLAPATSYDLPLALFDPEPNHLLSYCQFSLPVALPVSSTVPSVVSNMVPSAIPSSSPSRLGQWLQGVFTEGWQAIGALLDPDLELAFSTRNPELGAAGGKLIDLEMQIGHQTLALIVNITQESESKFGVLVQLHPTGGERYLPATLSLKLLSKAGKVLQEVQARSQDNYIQLRPFKGEQSKCFSLEVCFKAVRLREDFVL